VTTADDVLKLMMKHRGRLDYSNSNTGFYSGLREFFSQLAKEEEIAYRWENMDPVEYPDFGQNDDDYIDVVRPFYAAWNGFATKKSYLWKDYYRLSDAPDRRVRRLMEKENKGLRDDAIREFNDAVRSLVAFVRKRDPRYQENQKSEEERQKTLRDATAAQSTRSRASRQAKLDELDRMTVPDWATSTKVDEHQGGFSSNEDSEQQEIECVACNKTFKSEAQYEAHERSKKHIKLLKQLQREMRNQDQEFRNPDGEVAASTTVHHPASDADDENGVVENGVAPIANDEKPHVHEPANSPRADSDLDKDAGAEVSEESSSHEDDDDYAPRAELEGRLGGARLKHLANYPKATVVDEAHDVSDVEAHSVHNLGKAKQKRAKKAAQRDGAAKDSTRSDFKCAACQVEFPSKTKLFNHIKEKGHAAPVTMARFKGEKSGKGKKR
jgi:DnaJ homolog subfamily A member 5